MLHYHFFVLIVHIGLISMRHTLGFYHFVKMLCLECLIMLGVVLGMWGFLLSLFLFIIIGIFGIVSLRGLFWLFCDLLYWYLITLLIHFLCHKIAFLFVSFLTSQHDCTDYSRSLFLLTLLTWSNIRCEVLKNTWSSLKNYKF